MRPFIHAFIVLLILGFSVPPVSGQTITYSLLGHQVEVGPVEQCLIMSGPAIQRITVALDATKIDSVQYQPNYPVLIISSTVGAVAGLGASIAFGQMFSEECTGWI